VNDDERVLLYREDYVRGLQAENARTAAALAAAEARAQRARRDTIEACVRIVDQERRKLGTNPDGYWGRLAMNKAEHEMRALAGAVGDRDPTPEERDALIRSVISSEALSGIHVPREVAERALGKALEGPLPEIGGAAPGDQREG